MQIGQERSRVRVHCVIGVPEDVVVTQIPRMGMAVAAAQG